MDKAKNLEQMILDAEREGDQDLVRQLETAYATLKRKTTKKPPDQGPTINLKINIEDRKQTGLYFIIPVPASFTLAQLKRKVANEWNIPEPVQRWLINNNLLTDDRDKLSAHNITKSGDEIRLYVLSAKRVGLQRDGTIRQPPQPAVVPLSAQFIEGPQDAAPGPRQQNPAPQKKPLSRSRSEVGWKCPVCTFVNLPNRPGCEQCATDRPEDYQIPEDYQPTEDELNLLAAQKNASQEYERHQQQQEIENARNRERNLQELREAYEQNVILADDDIECSICFDTYPAGEGVVLRECLHRFCKGCLAGHIENCEEAVITCPFMDDYSCNAEITEQEIRQLVNDEVFEKYLRRSLQVAENQDPNSFHCKTPDCRGWCVYEDEVNAFDCPICNKQNCLTCKAIHEGINCKQYQEDIKIKALNDKSAQETQQMLERMLAEGEAMKCPGCGIVVQKKVGCDWIRCTMCKIEICWVTKGPRWGPKGNGDTSGGCRCLVGGKYCHPNCGNCH